MNRSGPVALAAPAGSGRSATAATAAASLEGTLSSGWGRGPGGTGSKGSHRSARGGLQCRVESSRQVLHLNAELLDIIQPSSQERIDVPFGAEPCKCLIVSPLGEVRPDARRAGGPAAKLVVPKHPECVYNGEKFEDVGGVRLLGCRELAALVGRPCRPRAG